MVSLNVCRNGRGYRLRRMFDASLLVPQRETTAKVYRYIRSVGRWNYDTETLCHRLDFWAEDYGQVAVSVEAMLEMGILIRDENGGLSAPKTSEKVNLQDAPVLKRLRQHLTTGECELP